MLYQSGLTLYFGETGAKMTRFKDWTVSGVAWGGILLCLTIGIVHGLYAMSLSRTATTVIEDWCYAESETLKAYNECTEGATFLYNKELRNVED